MNRVVVDTDVVSFIVKNHPTAALYESDLAGRWLRLYLERFVVLPYNRRLCTLWAEVTVASQALGRRIECAEAWIDATALRHDVPLVTHNRIDYLGVPNLNVISHGQ